MISRLAIWAAFDKFENIVVHVVLLRLSHFLLYSKYVISVSVQNAIRKCPGSKYQSTCTSRAADRRYPSMTPNISPCPTLFMPPSLATPSLILEGTSRGGWI